MTEDKTVWSASELFHKSGRLLNEEEWETDEHSVGTHLICGPYLTLEPGQYAAVFQLKAGEIAPPDDIVATLEITTDSGQVVVQEQLVSKGCFRYPDVYRELPVHFVLPQVGHGIEFRILCESTTYLAAKQVSLVKASTGSVGSATPAPTAMQPVQGGPVYNVNIQSASGLAIGDEAQVIQPHPADTNASHATLGVESSTDSSLAGWSSAAIRQLVSAAFEDEELTVLCYDHFRQVYDGFSVGMSKSQRVQRLLEHCDRHGQVEKLLRLIREQNPVQYERFRLQLG